MWMVGIQYRKEPFTSPSMGLIVSRGEEIPTRSIDRERQRQKTEILPSTACKHYADRCLALHMKKITIKKTGRKVFIYT